MKLLKEDFQYILPFLLIAILFTLTNYLGVLNRYDFAYFSGSLIQQPYRAITSHFFHADLNHLLSNTFGIVVARYFFKELGLKSSSLFIILVLLLIPLQVLIQWLLDMYFLSNPSSLLIGFSGILYGIDAFILLSSVFGKRKFLLFKLRLLPNPKVKQASIVLLSVGIAYSLMPGISLYAHLTGFVAGLILYLI